MRIFPVAIVTLALTATATMALADKGHWFQKVDTNGDGAISRDEATAKSTERFGRFDKNDDGQISLEEWNNVHLARFDKGDTNGDGQVTQEEIDAARALIKQQKQQQN